jgi:adenylosuccinate synthase
MPVDVVLGAQWGDEGKGKLSAILSRNAAFCARFQGGPNAGHSIVVDNKKTEFRMLPAGGLMAEFSIIGNGVVVHAATLLNELVNRVAFGHAIDSVYVSESAHVITQEHIDADRATSARLGTTGKGVGPAMVAKAGRIGIRIGDLRSPETLRALPEEDRAACRELVDALGASITNTGAVLRRALAAGARVVAEGGQGTFLDLDHGDYPYVTSSNTTIGAVLTGLGIGYRSIGRVFLLATAYLTKLGEGPFRTEVFGSLLETLQRRGDEMDVSRGELRRCGWMDVNQLRTAAEINDATHLVLGKLDVLTGLGYIEVHDTSKRTHRVFDAWHEDIRGVDLIADLPAAARSLLHEIESAVGVSLYGVSTGPAIDQFAALIPGVLAQRSEVSDS